jgi:hypothetical protein
VIAILLLVVIVVAMVVVVLIFATGIIRSLIAGGVATPITASGQMIVPGTTSNIGVLTLSMKNSQAQAIDGILVTCPSSFSNVLLPPAPACLAMTYNNNLVTAASPVPPGGTTVGSASVRTSSGAPLVAGTTYSVLVAVTFSGGSRVTIDVSVTTIS